MWCVLYTYAHLNSDELHSKCSISTCTEQYSYRRTLLEDPILPNEIKHTAKVKAISLNFQV